MLPFWFLLQPEAKHILDFPCAVDIAFRCDALAAATAVQHHCILPAMGQAILLKGSRCLGIHCAILGTEDDHLAIRHCANGCSATPTALGSIKEHGSCLAILDQRRTADIVVQGFIVIDHLKLRVSLVPSKPQYLYWSVA